MILTSLIALPRTAKRILLLASDSVLLIAGLWLSFSLRLDELYWPNGGIANPITWLVLIAPIIAVPAFAQFGLYRSIIRYLGMRAAWSVAKAVALYAVIWGLLALISGVPGIPRSVVIINAMVALLAVGGSRMLARWILRMAEAVQLGAAANRTVKDLSRVLIFGAGEAGRQLAVGLSQSKSCILLGFADDDPRLQGREIMSLPIVDPEQLVSFVAKNKVEDILLAVPSIPSKQRNAIIERLRPLQCRVRTLPGLLDMAEGKVDFSALTELDINDLLAREPANCDETLMRSQIENQVVMVSGAGGSIGSELCRQILARKPKTLLLYELNEYSLFTIHNELAKAAVSLAKEQPEGGKPAIALVPKVIPLLGSVYDELRVNDVLLTWQPNIIYHAAALKHVPLVEQNIAEGIKTNVLGTLTLAKASIEKQVERFVLISTDKAVNPTNAMGASKRCCELVLQALAAESNPEFFSLHTDEIEGCVKRTTEFSMVRFGNVLGSSGSVVPFFREQIKHGGPITLTHAEITRYFMTIPEAAQLVIQAGAMTDKDSQIKDKNAEVYVLDMGEPVKIMDLAKRMIELSGHQLQDEQNPSGDIAVSIIGLRPGEKLYEELLIGNNPKKTQHPRIMKAQEHHINWEQLQPMLRTMQIAANNGDVMVLRVLLQQLVPEYKLEEKVADWVYREQMAQATK